MGDVWYKSRQLTKAICPPPRQDAEGQDYSVLDAKAWQLETLFETTPGETHYPLYI